MRVRRAFWQVLVLVGLAAGLTVVVVAPVPAGFDTSTGPVVDADPPRRTGPVGARRQESPPAAPGASRGSGLT
ncbi:MAG: hypothetical protein ACRD0U_13255 [Acidimicrobiales bacterium]